MSSTTDYPEISVDLLFSKHECQSSWWICISIFFCIIVIVSIHLYQWVRSKFDPACAEDPIEDIRPKDISAFSLGSFSDHGKYSRLPMFKEKEPMIESDEDRTPIRLDTQDTDVFHEDLNVRSLDSIEPGDHIEEYDYVAEMDSEEFESMSNSPPLARVSSHVSSARSVAVSAISFLKGTPHGTPRERFQQRHKSMAGLLTDDVPLSQVPASKIKQKRIREFQMLRAVDTLVGLYMPRNMNPHLRRTLYFFRGALFLLFPTAMIVFPFTCDVYKDYTEMRTNDEVSVFDSQFLSKMAGILPFILWFCWHYLEFAVTPIWKHHEVWDVEPLWNGRARSFDVEILSREQFHTVYKHIRWCRYIIEYMILWCLSLAIANSLNTFQLAKDEGFSQDAVHLLITLEFATSLSHFFSFGVMIQLLFHIMFYFHLFKNCTRHLQRLLDITVGVDSNMLKEARNSINDTIRSQISDDQDKIEAADSVHNLWKTVVLLFQLVLGLWTLMMIVVMAVVYENAPLLSIFIFTGATLVIFLLILLAYMVAKSCWLRENVYRGDVCEFFQVMGSLLVFSLITPWAFTSYFSYVVHWVMLGFSITVVWLVFFLSYLSTFLYAVVMGTVHPGLPNIAVLFAGMVTGEKLTALEKKNLVKNLMSASDILKDGKDFAKDVIFENRMVDVADEKMVRLTRKLRNMTNNLNNSPAVEKFKKTMDMVVSIQAVSGPKSIKRNLTLIMNKLMAHINKHNKHSDIKKGIDTDSLAYATNMTANLPDENKDTITREDLEKKMEAILVIQEETIKRLRDTSIPKKILEELMDDIDILRQGFIHWKHLDAIAETPIEDAIGRVEERTSFIHNVAAVTSIDSQKIRNGLDYARKSVIAFKEMGKPNSRARSVGDIILPPIQMSLDDIPRRTPDLIQAASSFLDPMTAEDLTRKKDKLLAATTRVRQISGGLGELATAANNDIRQSFINEGTIRADRVMEISKGVLEDATELARNCKDMSHNVTSHKADFLIGSFQFVCKSYKIPGNQFVTVRYERVYSHFLKFNSTKRVSPQVSIKMILPTALNILIFVFHFAIQKLHKAFAQSKQTKLLLAGLRNS